MSDSDTIPLHPSSQSDIDEIENLIHASVQSGPATVLPARPPSPPRASIPVSSSPIVPSNIPPPPKSSDQKPPSWPAPPPPIRTSDNARPSIASSGFGSPSDTLTEPIWDTVIRDLSRIVNNLKLVVFSNPFREDPGKAMRDWDLWGPFFFIVFLGLTLSWSTSVKKELCFGTLCDPQDKWFYSLPFSYTLQNTKNWDTVSDGTTWKCERMRKSVSPSFQSVEEASCGALLGFGYRLDLGFVQCLYFILLYFWGRRK